MAFTGYLLPWDQKAYFATTVGTNMASEVPWIGSTLKRLMRGGNEMGTLTLSRFFVAHVFLLPAAILGLVAAHVYLFRKAGAAGPPVRAQARTTESFYPRQVLMDVAFTAVLVLALGVLAWFIPADLGPEANAADTRFLPRPEWYYVPVFQWLKYWPGARAIVGIVVIPALVAALFAGLPFLDRSKERRPWRRPFSVGGFAVVMLSLVGLGVQSRVQDERDPAISRQLALQHDAVDAFMKEPFEPEVTAGARKVEKAAFVNTTVAHGKDVFAAQACDACHGADARGSESAPSLVGVAARFPNGQLTQIVKTPNAKMSDGGMQPLDAPDPDIAALVAYLESLQ